MENFVFCINATMPIFFTMILGMWFRKIRLFTEDFVNKMNKFVFHAALPALLFKDIAEVDIREAWNGKLVIFCFLATVASIGISAAASLCFSRQIRGEFIQASYRSSSAVLGIAFIQNIYGSSGIAPLMIIASVPLYNAMAVVVLTLFRPGEKEDMKALAARTCKGIITNPIIIGIVLGILYSLLSVPMPVILEKTVSNLAVLATPLGLMAMGGSVKFGEAFVDLKPTIICAVMKLTGFVALFLPIGIHMGFVGDQIVSVLVMLGSATTVSCFIMAKNMGHGGQFSSGVIILTTLFSSVTLTAWLYLLKTMGLV
ncbi:AEC family transporter [Lachnoclostridium edouardi]|uniref:AEC family transporter n=1 Tax=Lachnoclostridium edouardi TaxID=1926283 RepID=UPI000C7A6C9A|nr:AEC family transporter [Lachnoclostridium edouardi]